MSSKKDTVPIVTARSQTDCGLHIRVGLVAPPEARRACWPSCATRASGVQRRSNHHAEDCRELSEDGSHAPSFLLSARDANSALGHKP